MSFPLSPLKAGSTPWYEAMFETATVDEVLLNTNVILYAKQMARCKDRYKAVEAITKVPWVLTACLHARESNLNFTCTLHNGENIIGKRGIRTKLVPKGRGPFESFEDSAIDALKIKCFDREIDWSLGAILRAAEMYNGLGYFRKHFPNPSPYLWSFTNLYEKGKYSADGQYDPKLVDKQPGVVAMLKALIVIGEFSPDLGTNVKT